MAALALPRQINILPTPRELGNLKKKSPSGIQILVDEASDTGTINNTVKLARKIFDLLENVASVAAAVIPAAKYFKSIADFFKVLAFAKSAKEIVEGTQESKWHRVAAGVFGIAIAIMTGIKILDSFKWIQLAKLSKTFAQVALVGKIVIAPFDSVLMIFEIMKSGFDIAVSSKKIAENNNKLSFAKGQIRFWDGTINPQERINSYTAKYHQLIPTMRPLRATIRLSRRRVRLLAGEYSRLINLRNGNRAAPSCKNQFNNLLLYFQIKAKKREWKSCTRSYLKNCETYNASYAKISKLVDKVNFWNQPNVTINQLNTYKSDKVQKWKHIKANYNLEKGKEGLSIFINCLAIITTVIALGFLFTPIGGIIFPVTLACLGLVIASLGLGSHLFKKYKKPREIEPVLLPRPVVPQAVLAN